MVGLVPLLVELVLLIKLAPLTELFSWVRRGKLTGLVLLIDELLIVIGLLIEFMKLVHDGWFNILLIDELLLLKKWFELICP